MSHGAAIVAISPQVSDLNSCCTRLGLVVHCDTLVGRKTTRVSLERQFRGLALEVALIGPLSSENVNFSGSPSLRGKVCMKFVAGATS